LVESEKKQSFWTTLPGFLTGVAALLTAVTGLLVAVFPHALSGSKEGAVAAVGRAETARPAPVSEGGSSAPAGSGGPAGQQLPAAEQRQKATVLVVGKDGTQSKVFRNSFRDSYSGESIQLKNGQSIAFDKVGSIDFLETHAYEQEVRVTLTDGRTVEGAIMSGEQITGDTDIGAFSISVKDVKRILFGP
jgi:hypothetical protein